MACKLCLNITRWCLVGLILVAVISPFALASVESVNVSVIWITTTQVYDMESNTIVLEGTMKNVETNEMIIEMWWKIICRNDYTLFKYSLLCWKTVNVEVCSWVK
ncbi:hypothetical protein PV325_007572 [Microctonus aethiopoides]|nr:hypothetical protein PV325_007572 [Microctonus aethiopoides]KAK0094706.1 hypothetical protein PV326_010227 [Microctonus aethiopoides]